MTHITCCDDGDLALCGQHLSVVGSPDGAVCVACGAINSVSPIPCPRGGTCWLTPKSSTTNDNTKPERHSLPRFDEIHKRSWWSGPRQPSSIDDLTDDELRGLIHEWYKPFARHEPGNHDCRCWRCTLLRDAGWYPEAPFLGADQMYIDSLRARSEEVHG